MYGVREHWPKRLRKRTLIVAEGKWACRGKRDNTHISRIFFALLSLLSSPFAQRFCTLSFAFYVFSTSLEHVGNHAQNIVFNYKTQWLISIV
jgi:hypothetical protein